MPNCFPLHSPVDFLALYIVCVQDTAHNAILRQTTAGSGLPLHRSGVCSAPYVTDRLCIVDAVPVNATCKVNRMSVALSRYVHKGL